jgi:hypothetical protein
MKESEMEEWEQKVHDRLSTTEAQIPNAPERWQLAKFTASENGRMIQFTARALFVRIDKAIADQRELGNKMLETHRQNAKDLIEELKSLKEKSDKTARWLVFGTWALAAFTAILAMVTWHSEEAKRPHETAPQVIQPIGKPAEKK